jgi:hypothetical protein
VALNLWKIGGQPMSYSPLSSGYKTVSVPSIGQYVVNIRARSASNAKLNVWLTGEAGIKDQILLTPNFTNYSIIKTSTVSNGVLNIVDQDTRGDIIIDSIELVQKPLPKLTLNGVDGFTSGKWVLHANSVVVDDETVVLNANGTFQSSYDVFDVLPNADYTHSINIVTGNGYSDINWLDSSGAVISATNKLNTLGQSSQVVRTPSNAVKAKLYITNSVNASGTFTFKRPMLNLGSTAVPYSRKTGDKMLLPVAKGDGTYQTNKKPKKTTVKARTGLVFNGTSDYLQLPSITMDSVEIDCLIDSTSSSIGWFLDFRNGLTNGYVSSQYGFGSDVFSVLSDGLSLSRTYTAIPKNIRQKLKVNFVSSGTGQLFVNTDKTIATSTRTKSILYKITCYLGNQIVAQYDFENPSNIVGANVLQKGINLIPNFEDVRWSLHANTQVLGKHLLRLNSTGLQQSSKITFPILPNTKYLPALNVPIGSDPFIRVLDSNLTQISTFWFTGAYTTPSNASYLTVEFRNSVATGTFDFSKPQLYALSGTEGTLNGAPTSARKQSRRTQYAKR